MSATSAQEKAFSVFPTQGIIVSLYGDRVDASGWTWRLNNAGRRSQINWRLLKFSSDKILEATTIFIAHLVRTRSSDNVLATFQALQKLHKSRSFLEAIRRNVAIPQRFFAEVRDEFGPQGAWRMHFIRKWFLFCCAYDATFFSDETAFLIQDNVVGGNPKGRAVLSLDPDEGPLDDLEITALLNALRAARDLKVLSLDELAAAWLCIAIGGNSLQFSLLREHDVVVEESSGQRFVHLRVPRIKKRSEAHRSEFRQRKLSVEIGEIVLALLDSNRRSREAFGWSDSHHAFPLFVRPRRRSTGHPEYARHLYSAEFSQLVARAIGRLHVISSRTGRALLATPRRLRYTYATRLVREGVCKRELADLLDHTDLQYVQVYFDVKSDIVEALDAAMALDLGPIAQAFLGKLVRLEQEAVRGDDPTSRIRVLEPTSGQIRNVGTCGEYSFCGRLAPIACYTCVHFQPWVDGPHDLVLQQLLELRSRRAKAGQDGRMIGIHDATILAIGDVITRIKSTDD